jgi:hypothetical protein
MCSVTLEHLSLLYFLLSHEGGSLSEKKKRKRVITLGGNIVGREGLITKSRGAAKKYDRGEGGPG